MSSRYIADFDSAKLEKEKFDIAIVGSGLAGLSSAFAASADKNKSIAIFSKSTFSESSSAKAEGGIAAPIGKDDSVELHVKDTIKTGNGLCNEKAVKLMVKNSIPLINELINLGLQFDKSNGEIDLGIEGGHCKHRTLHINGDQTGIGLVNFFNDMLRERENIYFFENHFLIDLLCKKQNSGMLFENKEGKKAIYSDATILATGGYSSLYKYSSNPEGSFGEGCSIAKRAGVQLMDLEFVQFHPTTIAERGRSFLTTESVRGEGGKIVNEKGERFVDELATRDRVSRAIYEQMKKGTVYLDIRDFKQEFIKKRFPSFYEELLRLRIDPTKDLVPIQPAAHYAIGGIKTDLNCRTKIKGVYAAGECACFGLHGANRLPCNSLLEAIVFGQIAGKEALKEKKKERVEAKNKLKKVSGNNYSSIAKKIKNINWSSGGMVRDGKGLSRGIKEIEKISKEFKSNDSLDSFTVQNMLQLSPLILKSALLRRESRGVHYRSDFRNKSLKWKKHTII